ncbi:MAG TPA: MFS transporter [Acidimicrobiia bacterium]|nr:MFS transporter [Acidimicrobiia bacterium]
MTVAAGVILATIDGSIVNIALPTMVEELHTSFAVVQWVHLAYLLALAALSLGVGRWGDVAGKKRIYATGFGAFTAASLLCGMAPGVEWLIAFRAIQAIGATMVLALGVAILTESYPPGERGKALGWIGTAVSMGIVTGPVVGGLLLSSFSWRSIFLVNLPVGIAGTLLAIRYVPDTPPLPGQRFDWTGAGLLGLSLTTLTLGVNLAQGRAWTDPLILSLLVGATLLGLGFVAVERRHPHPMINLGLFRNRLLTAGIATGFLTFVSVTSMFLLMPFFLEGVLGLTVRQTGLVMAASPLALGVVAPISGSLSDRFGARGITTAGAALLAVAYLRLSGITANFTVSRYLWLAVPVGIGMGVFQSPNNTAVMNSVPIHYLGVGSSLLNLTRLLGQIVGAATLGSLWANRVAAHLGRPLPIEGAPAAPASAQVAGFQDTYRVAAALMLIAVVICLWALRHDLSTRPHPGLKSR